VTPIQTRTVANIAKLMLELDIPEFDNLEHTTTPVDVELVGRDEARIVLHACERDGVDVTVSVVVDAEGYQAWTRKRYPAETFSSMAAPAAAYAPVSR
jgi:hypothetical protein